MTMTDTRPDLAEATAAQLAQALRRREISAAEAAEAAIARIEARDGPINAVVVRDFERAREQARAADAALARGDPGPLLGVPITVKEAFDVAGLPTTWGVEQFAAFRATTDAVAVQRLKAAGAVILGKTNVAPMLGDWQSDNKVYGRCNNPHDLSRTPGGSSGGSAAAVASGMVPLEFGSDIGGSIRVPSSFCGVWGHKPSYELIPERGHAPGGLHGASVLFGVVGPIARSAEDLALALEATAGPDLLDAAGYRARLPGPRHDAVGDYRVLILDQHPACATDDEIRQALDDAGRRLERAGARVSRASDSLPDLAACHATYLAMLGSIISRGQPHAGAGPAMSAHQYLDGLDHQFHARHAWRRVFEEVDVVLAPCFGVPAFPHTPGPWAERVLQVNGQTTPYGAQIAWPGVATFPHLPATATPLARSRDGLPIGVQVIGGFLEDRTTIAFAGMLAQL
jgi:amidase